MLQDGRWLNDNLITFYGLYMVDQLGLSETEKHSI